MGSDLELDKTLRSYSRSPKRCKHATFRTEVSGPFVILRFSQNEVYVTPQYVIYLLAKFQSQHVYPNTLGRKFKQTPVTLPVTLPHYQSRFCQSALISTLSTPWCVSQLCECGSERKKSSNLNLPPKFEPVLGPQCVSVCVCL